jgi:hypothetical protein
MEEVFLNVKTQSSRFMAQDVSIAPVGETGNQKKTPPCEIIYQKRTIIL